MQTIIYNGLEFRRNSSTGYIITGFKPNDIDVERDTADVVNTDGITVLNTLYSQRICKLTGYIYSKNKSNLQKLRRNLLKKCNGKTINVLTYYTGTDSDYSRYYADAVATVTECDIFGRNIYSFAVEFMLPNFYFLSSEARSSIEVSGDTLVYNSITTNTDAATPAKIILTASEANTVTNANRNKLLGLSSGSSMAVSDAITININDSVLRLSYVLVSGEELTVENLRAVSSVYGDVTEYVNIESKNLYLEENNAVVVSCDFTNAASVVSGKDFSFNAEVKYRERYIGV